MKMYTQDEVRAWLQEQKNISIQIEQLHATLSSLEQQREANTQKLSALITHELSAAEKKVELLQAQLSVCVLPEVIAGLTVNAETAQETVARLQRQLQDVNAVLEPLDREISKLQLTIEYFHKQERLAETNRQLVVKNAEYQALLAMHHAQVVKWEYLQSQNKDLRDSPNQLLEIRPEIDALESLQFHLVSRIQALLPEIQGWRTLGSVAKLQKRIDDVSPQRNPHAAIKTRLETKLAEAFSVATSLTSELQMKKHMYEEARSLAGEMPSGERNTLREVLVESAHNRNKLLSTKATMQESIANLDLAIVEVEQKIERLALHLTQLQSNQFLQQLCNNPNLLYTERLIKLKKILADYEDQHPAGQSLALRMALSDIERHVNVIDNEHAVCNSTDLSRLCFYKLTGLIWNTYRKIEHLEPEFRNALDGVLNAETAGAVDEREAVAAYNTFLVAHMEECPVMTREMLPMHERHEYENVARQLALILSQQSPNISLAEKDMHKQARYLLDTFNSVVKAGQAKDLKFHTKLLFKTAQLLQNPHDHALLTSYKKLAYYNHQGKPSICKKISGALFMFLGAASIVAGVCLGTVTMGIGSPISLGAMAGGTSLLASGCYFFYNGRQRAQEKALQRFNATIH